MQDVESCTRWRRKVADVSRTVDLCTENASLNTLMMNNVQIMTPEGNCASSVLHRTCFYEYY